MSEQKYFYRVSAQYGLLESALSDMISSIPDTIDGNVPVTPENLNILAGNTHLVLNWDSCVSATSYNIYWADSSLVNNLSILISYFFIKAIVILGSI